MNRGGSTENTNKGIYETMGVGGDAIPNLPPAGHVTEYTTVYSQIVAMYIMSIKHMSRVSATRWLVCKRKYLLCIALFS